MNYTVGQYVNFATSMAHEPPFANEQTNQEADANGMPTSACARTVPASCLTLATGFPSPALIGNYALDPHYQLPYVETWNVDVQKTLPWGIVMNAGYNGVEGQSPGYYERAARDGEQPGDESGGTWFLPMTRQWRFQSLPAARCAVNKRMTHGVSMGANYQYSHLIDNAGSEGGTAGVSAQNWQDLNAEEANGSLDVRHKVSGELCIRDAVRARQDVGDDGNGGAHSVKGSPFLAALRLRQDRRCRRATRRPC